jgi:phage tail-like protein
MVDFGNVGKGLMDGQASGAMKGAADLGAKLGGEVGGKLASQAAGMMMNQVMAGLFGRTDPNVAFTFYVEIDGIRCVKFAEARGLDWQAQPVQFYEGGNYRHKVSLVGQGSFSPLTLRKGFFAASGEFYQWMNGIMNPGRQPINRVTVSLVVLSEAGDEVGRFNLYRAFMTKYGGPGFNAMENSIAFEEIEIVYDWFDFVPGGAMAGALQAGLAGLGGTMMK